MLANLAEIQAHLFSFLSNKKELKLVEKPSTKEFTGKIPAMQGKQKVDGFYFASIVEKPKDVRFYFFPIYTHAGEFELSEELQKQLKGKSCFHLKKISEETLTEISRLIDKGIALYKKDNLI
tara:strand:+ start:1895 stop:2260 length:366 start_codon:yes stop_codon:yes gene_type:complete